MIRRLNWLVLSLTLPAFQTALLSPPVLPAPQLPPAQAPLSAFQRLPLYFEPNVGQAARSVLYLAHAGGYVVLLTARGIVLEPARGPAPARQVGQQSQIVASSGRDAAVQMTLLGANPRPTVTSARRQSGTINYLIGNNRRAWHTNIPTFAQVRYHAVYRGIDAIYYGTQQQLEFDFVVASGATPTAIRLAFAGAAGVTLDGRGDLVVRLAGGSIVEQVPVIYQQGAAGRVPRAGHFVLLGRDRVGLTVGRYDRRRPLVIDPAVTYLSYLGGSTNDLATSVATDGSGALYVAGLTGSGSANAPENTFPTSPGAFMPRPTRSLDSFITKLEPNGRGTFNLAFSTFLGSAAGDDEIGIDFQHGCCNTTDTMAVDPSTGNVFVTGTTEFGTSFPTTAGAFQRTSEDTGPGGGNDLDPPLAGDVFVTELNAAGSGLLYSTLLSGERGEFGAAIALRNGAIVVTGQTTSTRFPVTNGSTNTEPAYGQAFVTELNPDAPTAARQLVYSTYLMTNPCSPGVGSCGTVGTALAMDRSGAIDVAGISFGGTRGLATVSAFQPSAGCYPPKSVTLVPNACTAFASNAMVVQLVPAAGRTYKSQLRYASYLGGSARDAAFGLCVDSAGRLYVTGYATSGQPQLTPPPPLGGRPFPTTPRAYQTSYGQAAGAAFVAVVDPSRSGPAGLVYSTLFGTDPSIRDDFVNARGIALDGTGNVWITGNAGSCTEPFCHSLPVPSFPGAIPTTRGAFPSTTHPQGAYVAELIPNSALSPAAQLAYATYLDGNWGSSPERTLINPKHDLSSAGNDLATALALDAQGYIYLVGQSFGGLPVPLGAGAFQSTLQGGSAAFVARFLPFPRVAPLCALRGFERVGAAQVRLAVPGSSSPSVTHYLDYRSGASGFVIGDPVVSGDVRPTGSTEVIAVTGTVTGVATGVFHLKDAVTVRITLDAPELPNPDAHPVEVSDLSATPLYDQTLSGPYGPGSAIAVIQRFGGVCGSGT